MRPIRALLACLAAVLAALVLPSAASASRAAGGQAQDVPAPAASYLDRALAELGLPGVAVRVSAPGGSWTREHGVDDQGRAFTAATPVLIGSVAKSFTATAVLSLVEAGRIGLDDPVSRRLGWFAYPGITVRDLLRHTSGYDQGVGLAVADRFDTSPGALRRAAQDAAATAPTRPRGEYAYSDANYLLAGALIEAVTGRSYGDELRDRVLTPLGLSHSGASASTPVTAGHRSWWGTWRGFDPGYDDSGAPYGYVVSSLDDLDRYVAAHQSGRGLPLSAAHREAMQTRQADAGTDPAGRPMWYGFGWRGGELGDDTGRAGDGTTVVEHTGATPGFFTHALWLPDRDVRVVIVTNAYAVGLDAHLAAVARDLALLSTGRQPGDEASADPLLTWSSYLLVGLAAAGVAVGVLGLRSRPRRRGPLAAGALAWALAAALVGVAAWLAPTLLLGQSARTVRLWVPDVGWSLLAVALTWSVAAVLLLVRAVRRPVTRSPSSAGR